MHRDDDPGGDDVREARTVAGVTVLLALAAAFDQSGRRRDGAHRPGDDAMGPLGRLAGSLRDRVLDVVGPDEIVERLDVNEVLDRVDVDHLLSRVDANALLTRVDPDLLLDRVDPDALLDRVDVNAVLDRVDINALLDRIDINALLDRVDVNALLDRADVDRVVMRVDADRLLAGVDVDALLDRVDVDRIIDRVDVADIVDRAGIPDIVAESTGSLAESLLDMVRRQLLGLDVVVMRAVMRVLSRDERSLPAGPTELAGDGGPSHSMPDPNADVTDVTGHYAGPVTRLVAHVLDGTIAVGAFTITSGAVGSVWRTLGGPADWSIDGTVLFGALLVAWCFTYWWASTAVAGRTPGMALVGLRIVDRVGAPLSGRHAFLRVVTLPLSFALFGLGLLGILVDPERRALHDVIAGSTVVYDWGDRAASMPTPLARWLARHEAAVEVPPPRQRGARR
jgi:uncharacterized RDD family membrane protein YckC